MFSFESHPVDYRDPWAVPLGSRLQDFFREKVKVAYYYPKPDSSTFRYRCFNMSRAINRYLLGMGASWFCSKDGDYYLDWVAREASVVVVCRSMYDSKVAWFIQQCHRWGTTVLFDCDDYVFDPGAVPDVVEALNQTVLEDRDAMWTNWYGWTGRYRATLDLCDGLIVTNEYLAARAAETTDTPIYVLPNFMGDEQVEYSVSLVQAKRETGYRNDNRFDIGYFSGSPSHDRDFGLAAEALRDILQTRPQTRLRVVGHLEVDNTCLAGLMDRVEVIPFVNYMELQRLIAQTEVNIAPLQDNRFTNCKSELKYFDAGIVEVPTIASSTFTMGQAITDGVNGMICPDGDWFEAMARLVDGYETVGRPMAANAYEQCLATYTAEAVAPRIRAQMNAAAPSAVSD